MYTLLQHLSPPHWDIWKESMIYTKNINHHSLYVNKFRISPFTMRTSMRAGNATFPELINHTHRVIWQSTPNRGWGATIPRAQTHHLMWWIQNRGPGLFWYHSPPPAPYNKKCFPQTKTNNDIRGDWGVSVASLEVIFRVHMLLLLLFYLIFHSFHKPIGL